MLGSYSQSWGREQIVPGQFGRLIQHQGKRRMLSLQNVKVVFSDRGKVAEDHEVLLLIPGIGNL